LDTLKRAKKILNRLYDVLLFQELIGDFIAARGAHNYCLDLRGVSKILHTCNYYMRFIPKNGVGLYSIHA
jgi:hypothetical protein